MSAEPGIRLGVVGVGYLGRLHAQKRASFDDVEFVAWYWRALATRFRRVHEELRRRFLEDLMPMDTVELGEVERPGAVPGAKS